MADTAIHFDHFSFSYEDGTEALRDVSFDISHGESVGLIGHNGSGKSTLLTHIVGINIPQNGSITVSGLPVTKENLREIRKKVGYVFQDSRDQLFMSTVVEDVAFGPLNAGHPREEAIHRAEHALEAVGMGGSGDRIPYHLSGGEMRRVAIATVLAVSPGILVMDEPSSGLDPRSKRELAACIQGLDGTKLIASHDLEFIRACTGRVLLLHHGEVAAYGPVNGILDNTDLLIEKGL